MITDREAEHENRRQQGPARVSPPSGRWLPARRSPWRLGEDRGGGGGLDSLQHELIVVSGRGSLQGGPSIPSGSYYGVLLLVRCVEFLSALLTKEPSLPSNPHFAASKTDLLAVRNITSDSGISQWPSTISKFSDSPSSPSSMGSRVRNNDMLTTWLGKRNLAS